MGSDAPHLSRINTPWSLVRRARNGCATKASRELLELYGEAIRRYLGAVLRDDDATDELFQEFALRLVRGDFRAANPQRGKFRSFVKSTLYHLIVDYRRAAARRDKSPLCAPSEFPPDEPDSAGGLFVHHWRQELLNRSWASLAEIERSGSAPYYTALRLLVADSEQSYEELAARLSAELHRTLNSGNVRVVIHRARQMFAERLVAEVARSLNTVVPDVIEQELIDLNLLEYCRAGLIRFFRAKGESPAAGATS